MDCLIGLVKERAIALASITSAAVIIGSDQVATLGGEQVGKPGNHENALRQLQEIRGKQVIFHIALYIYGTAAPASQQKPSNWKTFRLSLHFAIFPMLNWILNCLLRNLMIARGVQKMKGLALLFWKKLRAPTRPPVPGFL